MPTKAPHDLHALYLETVRLIDGLRYRLRLSVKAEMKRHGIDLDFAQAMMLHAVGDREMRHSDLRDQAVYLGTNAAYNQNKLIGAGFLEHRRSLVDRREVAIKLTDKGHAAATAVRNLLERQATLIAPSGLPADELGALNVAMSRLLIVLAHQVAYRL